MIKALNESFFDEEKIMCFPYVTDKTDFKELNDQLKWFVSEKVHCKREGSFLKGRNNRPVRQNIIIFFLILA